MYQNIEEYVLLALILQLPPFKVLFLSVQASTLKPMTIIIIIP